MVTEIDVRLYKVGAVIKGIPDDVQERQIEHEKGFKDRCHMKTAFDTIGQGVMLKYINPILIHKSPQGKIRQGFSHPYSMQDIEDALSQLEQHLHEIPREKTMRCCNCGSLL